MPAARHRSQVYSNPSIEIDSQGRLWAGYSEGIAWLDDEDRWHKVPTTRPVALVRCFTLADGNGDDIWVAYRSPGRFSRLQKRRS